MQLARLGSLEETQECTEEGKIGHEHVVCIESFSAAPMTYILFDGSQTRFSSLEFSQPSGKVLAQSENPLISRLLA